jgi:hypothetical protein
VKKDYSEYDKGFHHIWVICGEVVKDETDGMGMGQYHNIACWLNVADSLGQVSMVLMHPWP